MTPPTDDTAPPPPAGEPEGDGEPASAQAGPQPLPKAPRLHPPTLASRREAAPQSPAPEPEVSMADLLEWARTMGEGSVPAAEPPAAPAEGQRAQMSREHRKFHKFDPEAAASEPGGTELLEGASVGLAADPDWTAGERTGFGAGRPGDLPMGHDPRTGLRRPKGQPRSLLSSLLAQLVVLILIGASFYLGRATMPGNTRAPLKRPGPLPVESDKAPDFLSPGAAALIDQAMAAQSTGQFTKAAALFNQVKRGDSHVEGLDYHLAYLDFLSGDFAAAMPALNHSIEEGEALGACYGLRGLIESRRRGNGKGLHDFEASTQADPFDPKSFFYWGEALRRFGKPQEALVRLQEAIDRTESPVELAAYRLKARLAQIDAGQEQEFAKQLAEEMARPVAPLEWVLTAAAVEMQKGNFEAAAADLDRAQKLAGPAILHVALRDFFFAAFADKEPVAAYYGKPPAPPAAGGSNDAAAPIPAPDTAGSTDPFTLRPAAAPKPSPNL